MKKLLFFTMILVGTTFQLSAQSPAASSQKTVTLAPNTEISFDNLKKKYKWNSKYQLTASPQVQYSKVEGGAELDGSFKLGNLRFAGKIRLEATSVQMIDHDMIVNYAILASTNDNANAEFRVETMSKIVILEKTKLTYRSAPPKGK